MLFQIRVETENSVSEKDRGEVCARRTIAALISKGNGVPSSEAPLNNAQTTAMLVIVYIKPDSATMRMANTKARFMR
jgi:hypothetical protein